MSVLARLVAIGLLVLVASRSSGEDEETPSSGSGESSEGRSITGVVLLDGAVNGCGGEQVTIQVRDSANVVGLQLADSTLEGADCVFRFNVSVPKLRCYELHVDKQPVGRYSARFLRDSAWSVGVITRESVYGEPELGAEPPRLYADFNNC